jgi:hypothetical protein
MVIMEWHEIKDTDDIQKFLEIFGLFHDSCIKELHLITESYVQHDLSMVFPQGKETKVYILFQRQFKNPSAIEVLFDEIDILHIWGGLPGYTKEIFGSTLLIQEGLFYWADQEGWVPNDKQNESSWISARKVKWRDVSDWMGDTVRYENQSNQQNQE